MFNAFSWKPETSEFGSSALLFRKSDYTERNKVDTIGNWNSHTAVIYNFNKYLTGLN